ncbi:uncharacterized protein LOC127738033 [Mytilus californianus]|uniref:uncharacterized protein LOC127738033 n=1 Tax=Mytilus californianus TaxID=6549 RepID=UPI0022470A2A|nr:uncharacterized protein LOC127738033 [Mytilus californianus]
MFNELQPTIDNYNTVVLHVGANDLSRGSSVKTLLRKYQQLTSDIWHSNPTADIIISGVLPRADNQFPGALLRTNFLTELNQRARLLNTKLQLLATRVPRLHYVGHPSFAQKGTIQRHLLSRDGLHLSYRGTSTVVKDIESAIRHLRKTKDTHDSIWELPTSTPTSTPTPTPKAPTPMPDPTEPAVDQSLYRTALLTLPIRTPTPTPKPVLTSTGIQVIEEWPALPRVCYLVSSLINTSSTSNTVHVPTTTSSSVPACTISPNPVCVAPTSTSSRSPTSTSYRLSTSTSNRLPTSTSNRLPTTTSNRLPTSTSNRLPTSTSNRSPTSNRLPTSTSNRLPTSTSNRLPTSTSNRSPTSNRLPTSTSNRLPNSTSNRLPTSTSNRLPTSTSNHSPSSVTNTPIYFKGAGHVLSNFYPCILTFQGLTFSSSEHLYQYRKAVEHSDFHLAHLIRSASTAKDCKVLSKHVKTNQNLSIEHKRITAL